jgi:catalase (peroxidase I)
MFPVLRFCEAPKAFADAFARVWFELTPHDMGPRARYRFDLKERQAA